MKKCIQLNTNIILNIIIMRFKLVEKHYMKDIIYFGYKFKNNIKII